MNEPKHPFDLILAIGSLIMFRLSMVTAEEFRQWTYWGIAIAVFVFALIRDWKKVKAQLKEWFNKK